MISLGGFFVCFFDVLTLNFFILQSYILFSCLFSYFSVLSHSFYSFPPPPVIPARCFPVFLALFLHFLDTKLVSSLWVFPLWLLILVKRPPPHPPSHPKAICLNVDWWEHVGGGGITSYCSRKIVLFLGVLWIWPGEMNFARHFYRALRTHIALTVSFIPLKLYWRLMLHKCHLGFIFTWVHSKSW